MTDEFRGMEINGRWVPRNGIERDYRCAKCHARVGRPYADPITGQLDHTRIVCAGPDEHEIRGPADVVHEHVLEWIDEKEVLGADDVLADYYWLRPQAHGAADSSSLYGDDNFEGFE